VRAFLAETEPERRTTRLAAILGGKPDIVALAAAVQRGWTWPSDAPKGTTDWTRETPGGKTSTVFAIVPASYEPSKAWPVLVWLHGGVGQPDDGGGASATGFLDAFADERGFLVVAPSSFRGAEWWTPAGVALVRGALGDLARRWRVDPDRVVVAGMSDGGSGCFHLAAHDPDPYASFVAIVPHPALTQLVGGALFGAGLGARPVWAVNGGKDPLYPSAQVEALVGKLREAGMRVDWRDVPEGGHDLASWEEKQAEILAFVAANPRPAAPDVVAFETSSRHETRRAWVRLVEARADAPADAGLSSTRVAPLAVPQPKLGVTLDNRFEGEGVRIQEVVAGAPADKAGFRAGDVLTKVGDQAVPGGPGGFDALRAYLASLGSKAGRFEVKRGEETVVIEATPAGPPVDDAPSAHVEARVVAGEGSERRIDVRTRGVGAFALDLAPPRWRPGERLRVVVNGKTAYEGVPDADPALLLSEASREGPLSAPVYARITLRP
jgi:S-formylglutathione hydrolase FrmB